MGGGVVVRHTNIASGVSRHVAEGLAASKTLHHIEGVLAVRCTICPADPRETLIQNDGSTPGEQRIWL